MQEQRKPLTLIKMHLIADVELTKTKRETERFILEIEVDNDTPTQEGIEIAVAKLREELRLVAGKSYRDLIDEKEKLTLENKRLIDKFIATVNYWNRLQTFLQTQGIVTLASQADDIQSICEMFCESQGFDKPPF